MFYLFCDNEEVGCWSNKAGDIFFDLTCESLGIDCTNATLVFFPPQLAPSDFSDMNVSVDNAEYLNEEGEVIATIGAIKYVENGNMLIQC
jgi:hypothetical protein